MFRVSCKGSRNFKRWEKAIVDYLGLKKTINVSLIKEVAVGDYLLIHSGVAIEKIDEKRSQRK